jgi:hypothetical protein
MSISSTGLYGSATIVNSDVFTDVENLKETVTTSSTTYLQTTVTLRNGYFQVEDAGLRDPGGEQAQRHKPASLSSESGESLRGHVGCYPTFGSLEGDCCPRRMSLLRFP